MAVAAIEVIEQHQRRPQQAEELDGHSPGMARHVAAVDLHQAAVEGVGQMARQGRLSAARGAVEQDPARDAGRHEQTGPIADFLQHGLNAAVRDHVVIGRRKRLEPALCIAPLVRSEAKLDSRRPDHVPDDLAEPVQHDVSGAPLGEGFADHGGLSLDVAGPVCLDPKAGTAWQRGLDQIGVAPRVDRLR